MEELKEYLEASRARKERLESKEDNPAYIVNLLHEVIDYIAELNVAPDNPIRLNSGIAAVDKVTGGLALGELVAINGDRASGRTALALHYAVQTAKETHKPVRIYSMAHSAQQITMRLLSMLSGIPISFIETARFYDEQWIQLANAGAELTELDICIYDMTLDVERLCDSLQDGEKNALLIIDGVSAFELDAEVMQYMQQFAKQMQCCVLFNSDYLPVTSYIEGNVDKVLWLEIWREDVRNFDLRWARYGKPGYSRLYWDKNCLRFTEEPIHIEKNTDDYV